MSVTDDLLNNNKLQLLEPYTTAKAKHLMRCLVCNHEWSATPLSKRQTYKKYGVSGCPKCKDTRSAKSDAPKRLANLQTLKDKGIEVLCGWDGRRADSNVKPIKIRVRNVNCGHEFDSTSANILSRGIICSVCGKEQRAAQLTQTSLDRSAEWLKTAPEWLAYRSSVDALTRVNYHTHKATINPNDYVRGLAGVEDAYQLDHIVPVRWCFDNNVPADVAAHHTNLQIISWRENVSEGGTLKQHINIPHVLLAYVV